MIDTNLLRRLEHSATKGPWTDVKPVKDSDGFSRGVVVAGTPGRQGIYANPEGGSFPYADCKLIVAARNALPALLDELDAAKSGLERMKASLRELHEKLDIGARCFPHSPSDIFSALLEMHGLGKEAAKP